MILTKMSNFDQLMEDYKNLLDKKKDNPDDIEKNKLGVQKSITEKIFNQNEQPLGADEYKVEEKEILDDPFLNINQQLEWEFDIKSQQILRLIKNPQIDVFNKRYTTDLILAYCNRLILIDRKETIIAKISNGYEYPSGEIISVGDNKVYFIMTVWANDNGFNHWIYETTNNERIHEGIMTFQREIRSNPSNADIQIFEKEADEFLATCEEKIDKINIELAIFDGKIIIPFAQEEIEKEKDIRNTNNASINTPNNFLKSPVSSTKSTRFSVIILLVSIIVIALVYFNSEKKSSNSSSNDLYSMDSIVVDTISEESYAPEYVEEEVADSVITSNKANIDFNSNEYALDYKTRLSEGYNSSEVNFANFYIAITWGCGMGCVYGMMVDIRDGKIYDLPLGEDVTNSACPSDDGERITFEGNSNLLTVLSCTEIRDENSNIISYKRRQYNNIWDEEKKEFITTISE
jgi:hypothetical protein